MSSYRSDQFVQCDNKQSESQFSDPELKPTVCQLVHNLSVAGAEMLAAGLGRSLSDEYRVVFVCLDESGSTGDGLQRDGFAVEVLDRRSGIDLRCVKKLADLFRRYRVDLIHAHQYTPFFYAVASRTISRRQPVLFTEHGRHFPDSRKLRRVLFNRICLKRRDGVVGVGNSVRNALIQNEGIPADRVEVIYNGVNLDDFSPSEAERREVRRHLGLSESEFVVVQVARLHPLKDHATALRAIAKSKRQIDQMRFVVVGDGPDRRRIEADIERLKLRETVMMLGTRDDVRRILAAADVALLTSVSEGIPVTLIEAMAAELPVVATDVGGVSEVVIDKITGQLAPAGDDDAISAAIVRLANDHALRRTMGCEGSARARELFCGRKMQAAYRAIYSRMIRSESNGNWSTD